MEKIYMEQNKNKKKKRNIHSSTSIMMSFILAFVSILSIVAYAFGQISFAIPAENVTPFPDTIQTGQENQDSEVIIGSKKTNFQIRLHQAQISGQTKYVICIEKDVSIASNSQYKKDSEITDKGLLFLLKYLLSTDTTIVDATGATVNEKARGWIAQTAVWIYQKQVGAVNNSSMTEEEIKAVLEEVKITTKSDAVGFLSPVLDMSSHGKIYDVCKVKNSSLSGGQMTINDLLTKAKNIHNGSDDWNNFTLDLSKKSDNISLTEDGNYYQSDVITVTGSEGFKGFKIDLSKAPEGTQIFKTDGTELKDEGLDNLVTGTQFVVRVPKDKITEENKAVTIQVTGAFEGDLAYKYVADQSQAIAYTGKITKHVQNGITLDFNYTPEVPDTSFTTAQTIYFIGLIILLTGVGIIYANIKPLNAKQ